MFSYLLQTDILLSGKSSLISALLNLLNLKSGTISIDSLNISKVPRQSLRERLNTLPQEAIVFDGTVRENLSLGAEASDQRMIEVLTKLQLWAQFQDGAGLDEQVSEDTLSHGQRQLLCMARAILKAGKIVVMDESTSRYAFVICFLDLISQFAFSEGIS